MTILKHKVEFLVILKTRVKLYDEGMIDVYKHVSLNFHMVLLFFLLNFLFLQDLHSMELSCVNVLYKEDFSVGAFSYD